MNPIDPPNKDDYDSFDGYVDALERKLAEANEILGLKIWQAQITEATRQVAASDSLYRKTCEERDEWMTRAHVAERHEQEAKDLYRRLHESHRERCESDSVAGSCDCNTKTNEVQFHKPGCRYRLISERNAAVYARDEAVTILKLVMDDAPSKSRDWLNPTTEQWANEIVARYSSIHDEKELTLPPSGTH